MHYIYIYASKLKRLHSSVYTHALLAQFQIYNKYKMRHNRLESTFASATKR